jgi:hypothetical protein
MLALLGLLALLDPWERQQDLAHLLQPVVFRERLPQYPILDQIRLKFLSSPSPLALLVMLALLGPLALLVLLAELGLLAELVLLVLLGPLAPLAVKAPRAL